MKKLFTLSLLFFTVIGYSATPSRYKILVFSKTAGYRHSSIEAGIAAIKKLGDTSYFTADLTEDAAAFTLTNLKQYQAVVFLSTTGEILNATQQLAFEQYIAQGGGFVGIHAAADTEYDWPWYGGLVGAYFKSHPTGTPAAIVSVSDHVHPSTSHLPAQWIREDEWYNYKENPRGEVHVLATLRENSYTGGEMGTDHPIAWCHSYQGGRAWYTGGGHTEESYSDANFIKHIYGGIQYAAGAVQGQFDATVENNYAMSVIDPDPNQPVMMEVFKNGKVLYIERGGTLKLYNPQTGIVKLAGRLKVDSQREDGLIGLTLDPDFDTNHQIYLFYSPAGSTPVQHVSRFIFDHDSLHTTSEKVVISIPVQREECCHSGGGLAFDGKGNLFIALGDNTNPFASGTAPLDEKTGRANFDAQRTAGNTADLRGKILRITPQANGTYTIPEGNLFTGTQNGRPEIFVMGTRNPYRISVDKKTGTLYWGDVGPDGKADGAFGPKGYDEWNRTTTAGNFGWPYCIANNKSYVRVNSTTGAAGTRFDCAAPVNLSPNNTGATALPPARSAWIWYSYDNQTDFPEIGFAKARTAMAGPVYHYEPQNSSAGKLPPYFDNSLLVYDWSNNWVKEIKTDAAGNLIAINPFLTSFKFASPIDMKIGPDGSIYVMEWGTGYFNDNPDARIIKIEYSPGERNPVAVLHATPDNGSTPLTVQFSAADSYDEDKASTLTYSWDFTNDGIEDATGVETTYTYTTPAVYIARLIVKDNTGLQSFTTRQLIAGNSKPQLSFLSPPDGGFFDWKDSIPYQLRVSDLEDAPVGGANLLCKAAEIRPALGHNEHAHDENSLTSCEGVSVTPSGHGDSDGADNVYYVLNASYRDKGVNENAALALTGKASSLARPKRLQAEFFSTQKELLSVSLRMLPEAKDVLVL